MADGSDELKQKVETRRGKAERAAAAVQMNQDRLAAATKADDQAEQQHGKLKDSLAEAEKTAKKLSKKTAAALQLKKSALKERRGAGKDLARSQDLAAKHMAKLVELQAAETTQNVTDQMQAGNAEAAVRTAGRTSIEKSTRSSSPRKTSQRSSTRKAGTGKRAGTSTSSTSRRTSAKKTTAASGGSSTNRATGSAGGVTKKTTAKRSTSRGSGTRTAAKSPAKRSPARRTARKST